MIGNNDGKSHTNYLLGENINESKKIGIAGVNGAAGNYEAVNEFIKNIFKAAETKPIIGKVECFSGPVRESDKKKTMFVLFYSVELRDRVFHASD